MKLLKTIGALTVASILFSSQLALADEAASVPAAPAMKELSASAPAADEKTAAEAKITKDQALELARKAVTVPDGYTLQNVNLYGGNYPQQGPVWNLNFVKKQGEQYLGSMNIQLSGITGKLIGFNSYNSDPSYKPSYPPKVDYQGAKDIAAKWVAEKNPEAKGQIQYNDSNEKSFRPPLRGGVQYEIRYDRVNKGIPFPQNYVSVTVNGEGDVVGYSCVWNDQLKFDDAQGALSAEAAMKAMREVTEPSLAYVIPYQSKDKKPLLTYNAGFYPIDAKTGDIYLPSGAKVNVKPNLTPLTEKPLGTAPAANLNLTKEEAVARVTAQFKLPDGAKLQDAGYSENIDDVSGKTVSTWNLNWSVPVSDADSRIGKPAQGVWASVNSKTGEILNFNAYRPYELSSQADVKVSAEDAKAKAVDFVKKLLPAYTNQLVLQSTDSEPISIDVVKQGGVYTFSFARYLDGVRAGYDNVYVSIDAVTGDISNYSFGFSQVDYPAQKPETISSAKAEELLFSAYDLQLQYVNDMYTPPFSPLMGAVSDAYMSAVKLKAAWGELAPSNDTGAHLIYALVPKYPSRSFVLDAVTGGWLSPDSGEPVSLENVKVTDIDGHWAQSALQLMLDYQALDVKDGKVNPDASITKGELIKMLVISMNGGNFGFKYDASRANSFADVKSESPYFPYVERAVDLRILDRQDGGNFNPNATLTREEMAELIVKALGYGKLAEHDDIFSKSLNDEAQLKHPGNAAIVVGLGIMTAPEGLFEPAETVTKAQAATAFTRYLEARAQLQSGLPFGPAYG